MYILKMAKTAVQEPTRDALACQHKCTFWRMMLA